MSVSFQYDNDQWARIAETLPERAKGKETRTLIEGRVHQYLVSAEIEKKQGRMTKPRQIGELRDLAKAIENLEAAWPKHLARWSIGVSEIRVADHDEMIGKDICFSSEAQKTRKRLLAELEDIRLRCNDLAEGIIDNPDERRGSNDLNRDVLIWGLLDDWMRKGGSIRVSVLVDQQPKGPVIRYLQAVTDPILDKKLTGNAAKKLIDRYKKPGG